MKPFLHTNPSTGLLQESFKHSLMSKLSNEISFGLGIASLICWAVAEIPQIITNFNNKSASGVSLAFLSTWIVGDVFNLTGCMLEPSTLPTQFYTALLYTIVTVILALQCVYYNHFLQLSNRGETNSVKEEAHHFLPKYEDQRKYAPIEVPNLRNFHFMSARSLAGSDTPPFRCYMKAQSGPPALGHDGSSSEEEEEEEEKEESTIVPQLVSQPRPIPRVVKYGTFVAASADLAHLSRALIIKGEQQFDNENVYGQWLGWMMAAIYMGGRLPQIWLNIKRGSVEGLNPLMFVFALVANATYVGSILVISTEWRMIKGNFPWLFDAIVCVVLDLFIILQYIFYKYIKRKRSERCGECYGDFIEADKPI